jgi:hypothetical protein
MPQRILLHHVACSCRIHADFLSRYLALIMHCHFDIKQTDHQNLECRKTKLILFKQKTLVCRSTTYLRSLHWNLKPELQSHAPHSNPMDCIRYLQRKPQSAAKTKKISRRLEICKRLWSDSNGGRQRVRLMRLLA